MSSWTIVCPNTSRHIGKRSRVGNVAVDSCCDKQIAFTPYPLRSPLPRQGLGGLATPPPYWPSAAWSTRSDEHTSELQSLMRISYAVFCLKKKKKITQQHTRSSH